MIRPRKTSFIYVYDESLRLLGKNEVPIPVSENCDIQILAFKDHYFLYSHIPKTSKYQLWKIDNNGNVKDMLPIFRELVDEHFKDKDVSVQIMADRDNLYLRTQVYFPQLGKIKITMVTADTMLNISAIDHLSLPFNKENENLQQVLLLDKENIIILKGLQNKNSENLLEVIKCNFKKGSKEAIQFNVSHSMFAQPTMHFNPDDSTITLYSMIRASLSNQGFHRSLFMCRLTYFLQPVSQVATLKSHNLFSFFLIKDMRMNWLHFIDAGLSFHNRASTSNWKGLQLSGSDYNYMDNDNLPQLHEDYYQKKSSNLNRGRIRFSIVDQQLKIVKDSTLLIDNQAYIIRLSNFGKFQLGNKSYLIMEQRLPNKSVGLIMISNKGDKTVDITDLHVHNRFNYYLSQVQQVSDRNIIIPYAHKGEVGLMKLDLN